MQVVDLLLLLLLHCRKLVEGAFGRGAVVPGLTLVQFESADTEGVIID